MDYISNLPSTSHITYITGTASAQYWIGTVGNAVLNYCDMSGTYLFSFLTSNQVFKYIYFQGLELPLAVMDPHMQRTPSHALRSSLTLANRLTASTM